MIQRDQLHGPGVPTTLCLTSALFASTGNRFAGFSHPSSFHSEPTPEFLTFEPPSRPDWLPEETIEELQPAMSFLPWRWTHHLLFTVEYPVADCMIEAWQHHFTTGPRDLPAHPVPERNRMGSSQGQGQKQPGDHPSPRVADHEHLMLPPGRSDAETPGSHESCTYWTGRGFHVTTLQDGSSPPAWWTELQLDGRPAPSSRCKRAERCS